MRSLLSFILIKFRSLTTSGLLFLLPFMVACNKQAVEEYPLIVLSMSPNWGSTIGGDLITFTGSGLEYVKTIEFDGSPCTEIKQASPITLTCYSPTHSAGFTEVIVTNSIGKEAKFTFAYEVVPVIEEVTPAAASPGGGDLITINGSGFVAGATVEISGNDCPVSSMTTTTINCTSPAYTSSGFVPFTVTNPNGKSDTETHIFAYRNNPVINTVTPIGGPPNGGTLITVKGSNFVSGASVDVGGLPCNSVNVLSSGTLTCLTSGVGIGSVGITVTNSNGLSGTRAGLFTYRNPPTIASISPNEGFTVGGQTVTVNGTGFLPGARVFIGGNECTGVALDGTFPDQILTCTTGQGTNGVHTVQVVNVDSQVGSLADGFTYEPAPVISSISPTKGALAGGMTMTITGSFFEPGATVTIDGSPCTPVSFVSSSELRCPIPGPHAAGAVDVVVTNPDTQIFTLTEGFVYRGPPVVTSVYRSGGRLAGGDTITITGSGFFPDATIDLGVTPCTNVEFVSDLTLRCRTPNHAAGAAPISVTNDDAQVSNTNITYMYNDAPTISAISPNTGIPAGGATVEITGSNFLAGATVTFDVNDACTSVNVLSPTRLTCTVPAHAVGTVTVTVTNPDEQSVGVTAGYNYQSQAILTWVEGLASPTPPNPMDYGIANSDITHTFTLRNTGDIATDEVPTITITGTGALAWAFGTNNCTGVLAPSATCTVQATLLGSSGPVGVYSAVLDATSISGGTDTTDIQGEIQHAVLEWDVAAYDYGTTSTNLTQIFTLTNTGLSAANAVVATESDSQGAYTMTLNGCNTSLNPGDQCSVHYTFDAASKTTGNYSATLYAADAAGATDSISIGGYANTALLVWDVTDSDWGSTSTTSSRVFTLTNTGPEPTSPTLTIGETDTSNGWTILSTTCPANLAGGGASCTVTMQFDAGSLGQGSYSGQLNASAPVGGTPSINLTGSVP